MTKIEYRPHCGKCGALIDEEVIYQYIIIEGKSISDYVYPNAIAISPCRCNNCGETFNMIEIKEPKKDEAIRIK